MKIERLEPNVEVRWQCVDAHIHAPGVLRRTNEWAGTSIVFQLLPQSASSTLLKFEHIGLVPKIECFEICTAGWNQFLDSLKSYVETGAGKPYVVPES